MWVDYWELTNRLGEVQQAELDAFSARWSGTYVEDRLRNDWLLELGRRRDWANFAAEFPRFRMNDDREVTCYALLDRPARRARTCARPRAPPGWRRSDADDGCALLGATLSTPSVFAPADVWTQGCALAIEAGRPRAARQAAALLGRRRRPRRSTRSSTARRATSPRKAATATPQPTPS